MTPTKNERPITDKIREWIYISTFAAGVMFWFFTIYGLPERVKELETKMAAIELNFAKMEAKLDGISGDTTIIKNFILGVHGITGQPKD